MHSRSRLAAAVALSLIALVVLSGCGSRPHGAGVEKAPDASATPGAEGASLRVADYFPGEPGMTWRYRGRGNEFAFFVAEATHREGERVQIVSSSGARVARVYEVRADRVTQILQRAEVETNESFLRAEAEMARIILSAPLIEGREWQAAPGERRRIEAVRAAVETPAGRFENALLVRVISDGSMDVLEAYALGVGLVRRGFLADEPIVSELEEFVIRSPKSTTL